jgi:hypothetical protein
LGENESQALFELRESVSELAMQVLIIAVTREWRFPTALDRTSQEEAGSFIDWLGGTLSGVEMGLSLLAFGTIVEGLVKRSRN